MRILDCILSKEKGTTPETAVWLDRRHIPFFMQIPETYCVVVPKQYVGDAPFGIDQIYRYGLQNKYKKGPVYFIECPFSNLPDEFWVRKVVMAFTVYEFIPTGDETATEPRYPSPSKR
jgi:hypothetical protein